MTTSIAPTIEELRAQFRQRKSMLSFREIENVTGLTRPTLKRFAMGHRVSLETLERIALWLEQEPAPWQ